MERETKTITTPVDQHKLVLKTYITGREKREIQNVFFEETKLSFGNDETIKTNEISGAIMNKANDKTLELLIVSVNGETENIIDKILDMKVEDYEFVISAINEISSLKKK